MLSVRLDNNIENQLNFLSQDKNLLTSLEVNYLVNIVAAMKIYQQPIKKN